MQMHGPSLHVTVANVEFGVVLHDPHCSITKRVTLLQPHSHGWVGCDGGPGPSWGA